MYAAAELAAETLDGRGWKQIVREEIFQVDTNDGEAENMSSNDVHILNQSRIKRC